MSQASESFSTPSGGFGNHRTRREAMWISVKSILIGLVTLSAGWWGLQAIFLVTWRPPAFVTYLLATVLSVVLGLSVAAIVGIKSQRSQTDPRTIGKELLRAMDQISHGDFSARISPVANGPFWELVDSVNKMANQLGTMEQQRQEFISNVSHEIQSPLTSISGFTSLLRDDDLDPSTRHHYVDVIATEAKRLSTLSDNLLRLMALEDVELDRRAYRLDDQLRSVVATLEPQWSAKAIHLEILAEPTQVDADEEMMSLVWTNLVTNAIKYTPDGGRITVTITKALDHVLCTVSDTGIGIAESDLPHIFERFFRVDKSRSGEGNGLGLALAKRIVEVHSGKIDVSSHLDSGTTMSVRIPASSFTPA